MTNNNFFALAALQTKESMEALRPGQIFNAYAFEMIFQRKGVEFTKAFLDQIQNGVGLFHGKITTKKRKGNNHGKQ